MPLTRRRALIGTTALVVPSTIVAQTVPLVTIRAGMTPQVGGVPVLYAQQSGLFRNAGLDLIVQKINSGAATAAAMAGGGLDVGILNTVTVIEANAHGVGLSILFPNRMHVPGKAFDAAMVTAAGSSVRNGRDLNGRTIGCTAIKDASWLLCRAWMDANGGDSATAKFVEVPFSAIPVALESGRIDAGLGSEPFLSQGVKSGKVRSLGDVIASFGLVETTAYVATTEYLAKNRDIARRFARAIREAQQWCNAHPAEIGPMAAAFTGNDRAMIGDVSSNYGTDVDAHDVQPWINACLKYSLIAKSVEAADLFVKG